MTARNDSQRGLRAKVYASDDAVRDAIIAASDLLGKRSSALINGSNKVAVKLQTTTVGVSYRSGDDGAVEVIAQVETFRTSQEKLFYLIPVGPKMLQNKGSLVTFLKALHPGIRQSLGSCLAWPEG